MFDLTNQQTTKFDHVEQFFVRQCAFYPFRVNLCAFCLLFLPIEVLLGRLLLRISPQQLV